MHTNKLLSRRRVLQGMAAAGAVGLTLPWSQRALGSQSPNERPVFATIGLRNQGWTITDKSFEFADFAALADVDANVLGSNVEKTDKNRGRNRTPTKITAKSWIAKTSTRS